jgi:hypothetical protein
MSTACSVSIRKFVDPDAEFIFVPADQVVAKARELGATPFDVEDLQTRTSWGRRVVQLDA